VQEALRQVSSLTGNGPIALRNEAWAPGIVGLIAGRLADSLGRPVAVAAPVGSDELRGSVRAPKDFHAAAALEACAPLLVKRGGHAGAGGFSVATAGWDTFASAFAALPRPYPADSAATIEPADRVTVDLVLPADHLGWSLAGEIARLAPFGPGHVEPILAVTGLRVGDARRIGPDGKHLALRMLRGAQTFDAIAFGEPNDRPLPEGGSRLDVVGTLERDTFQDEPRLRLRVVDYATADASPLAARRLGARSGRPTHIPVVATVASG
jgi:single-stranded-DNA-specific exonuclease